MYIKDTKNTFTNKKKVKYQNRIYNNIKNWNKILNLLKEIIFILKLKKKLNFRYFKGRERDPYGALPKFKTTFCVWSVHKNLFDICFFVYFPFYFSNILGVHVKLSSQKQKDCMFWLKVNKLVLENWWGPPIMSIHYPNCQFILFGFFVNPSPPSQILVDSSFFLASFFHSLFFVWF